MHGRRAATGTEARQTLALLLRTAPNGKGLGAKGLAGTQQRAEIMAALRPLQPVLGAAPGRLVAEPMCDRARPRTHGWRGRRLGKVSPAYLEATCDDQSLTAEVQGQTAAPNQ